MFRYKVPSVLSWVIKIRDSYETNLRFRGTFIYINLSDQLQIITHPVLYVKGW